MICGQRIDFFQQVRAFDYMCKIAVPKGITGNIRSVYFALLSINNDVFWSEVFDIDYDRVLAISKVDKETYRRAMNFFYENDFFHCYEKGVNRWARARVSLKLLYEKPTGSEVGNPTGGIVPNTVGNRVPNEHFNKTVNTKPIKPINKIIDFNSVFNNPEFSDSSEEMVTLFKRWLDYKKSRSESYKSIDSVITSFKNLKKYSGENFQIAVEIIDAAIGSGYQGFFRSKTGVASRAVPAAPSKAQSLYDQKMAVNFTND